MVEKMNNLDGSFKSISQQQIESNKQKLLTQTKNYMQESLKSFGNDWQEQINQEKDALKCKMEELQKNLNLVEKRMDLLQNDASELTCSYEEQSASIESDLDTKSIFQSILDQRLSEEDLITSLAFCDRLFNIISTAVYQEYNNLIDQQFTRETSNLSTLKSNIKEILETRSSSRLSLTSQTSIESALNLSGMSFKTENQTEPSTGNQTPIKLNKLLSILEIHRLRRKNLILSTAYDKIANLLNFDNSGSKDSNLAILIKFYHNFSGGKMVEIEQLKDNLDELEIRKFAVHLGSSVQDTKLLKALVDCIKIVESFG